MLQTLNNQKKHPPNPPMPHKGVIDDQSDVAKRIGKDWFDAAIKKDNPHVHPANQPKDEKNEGIKPTVAEKEEGDEQDGKKG